MSIGVLQLDLFIPQANSLKSKRQVLKSLKDKIRHKFNVSIAEIDSTDKWQRAVFAVVCVSSQRRLVNSVLSKIAGLAQAYRAIEVINYTMEFL